MLWPLSSFQLISRNHFIAALLLLGSAVAGCDSAPAVSSPGAATTASLPAMKPPFPIALPYTKAEIPKLFGRLEFEQDPDSALHFAVLIPQQWGQVKGVRHLVTPAHPFELRGHVKSLSGPEAEVKVTIALVGEEVSPSDWLSIYLEAQGEKVLQERHVPHEGGAIPDVLTTSGTGPTQRISRWLVLKDWAKTGGAHFFLVQASTPAANYTPEMANIFFMAVTNFNITHPTKWDYAEQLRTLVRAVPAKVSTVFPISWQQQENPQSDEHFYQVKLSKELAGRRIGLINLLVSAGQTEADLRRLEEESRAAYVAEKLEFAPAEFKAEQAFGAFQQVYAARTPQTNAAADTPAQERIVIMARTGSLWVYLENVRFTREDAPQEWAISKRAFDIVQEHLVVKP
jgi:hypothetical protein